MRTTKNFALVIQHKLDSNLALAAAVATEELNADIARKVHRLRTEANLTQRKLASLVGTQQSVIARLEDADYRGHSLTMLQRIARALKKKLSVEFINSKGEAPPRGKVRAPRKKTI